MTHSYLPNLKGQSLCVASCHEKEEAFLPSLGEELGMFLCLPYGASHTDHFGTFTREISRPEDQETTLRMKVEAARTHTGCSYGIGSEGAFGPDPYHPYLPLHRELLLFIDKNSNYEIIIEHRTWEELKSCALRLLEGFGVCVVEPDMRAHRNPKRMAILARMTQELVEALGRQCSFCAAYGVLYKGTRRGAPCRLCSTPTGDTLEAVYQCTHCKQQETTPITPPPAGDPSHCPRCNP